jgi:ribonuclease VapC
VTIAIDTSAFMALLLAEPEADAVLACLLRNQSAISAGTLIELNRVAALRLGAGAPGEVKALLETHRVEVVPVDERHVHLADEGNLRFGKGRSEPPAVLNFGDLFAYALARQLDAPLLFKGDDFARTDVKPAL